MSIPIRRMGVVACTALALSFAGALALAAEKTAETPSKAAKVDLNTASKQELEALPGVGEATAEKIIAGRPYSSVSGLEKAGVSAKTVAQIKPLVTVHKTKAPAASAKADTATPKEPKTAEKTAPSKAPAAQGTGAKVDLNSASEKELEDLPGVGPATAQKIIAGRPYASVAELEKAGVTTRTIEQITPLVTAKSPKAPASHKSTSAKPTASAKAAGSDEEVEARTPPRPGLVWVNTESKVFHTEGDRWYGKTKKGEWMTEAEALKAGYRPVKEPEAKPKE